MDDAFDAPDPSPSAQAWLESGEAERLLHASVAKLDPQTAFAIRTAFIEGATYRELAERLAAALPTIKSPIRRGLLQLRDSLEP